MFTNAELEVLSLLWTENRALTKHEIVELTQCKNYKPNTVYFVINGLLEKGAIQVTGMKATGSRHYSRTYTAAISQEEYAASHLSEVLPSINFSGIFSALAGKMPVSREALDDLRKMIEEMEKDAEEGAE